MGQNGARRSRTALGAARRGGAHQVLGDVGHQQADEDEHDADGAPHGRHGYDDVPHGGRLHAELHAVGGRRGARRRVAGLQAEAVPHAAVRLGQQVVAAGGAQLHAVAGEARVGAVPGAVEREAAQAVAGTRRRPLQQHAAVAQHVGHQRAARGAVGAAGARRALEAQGRSAEAQPPARRALGPHLVGAPRLIRLRLRRGLGERSPRGGRRRPEAEQGEQGRQQAGHAGRRRMEPSRGAGGGAAAAPRARYKRGLRSRCAGRQWRGGSGVNSRWAAERSPPGSGGAGGSAGISSRRAPGGGRARSWAGRLPRLGGKRRGAGLGLLAFLNFFPQFFNRFCVPTRRLVSKDGTRGNDGFPLQHGTAASRGK